MNMKIIFLLTTTLFLTGCEAKKVIIYFNILFSSQKLAEDQYLNLVKKDELIGENYKKIEVSNFRCIEFEEKKKRSILGFCLMKQSIRILGEFPDRGMNLDYYKSEAFIKKWDEDHFGNVLKLKNTIEGHLRDKAVPYELKTEQIISGRDFHNELLINSKN